MIKTEQPLLLAAAIVFIVIAVLVLQAGKAGPAPSVSQVPENPASDPLTVPASKAGFLAAPELAGISGYLNAPDGFRLADTKGKVVLVDFWTFSCINCIRTLPYLKDWHAKYAGQGLVIVGVHTPEFDFEKDIANVKSAVEKYGIGYPVVLDNDYGTWKAYRNQYWPHHYLIDAEGFIRFDHIGEGNYEETETQIVQLLKERNASISMNTTAPSVAATDFSKIGTPEIYFGTDFIRQPLGNDNPLAQDVPIRFTFPSDSRFTPDSAYLDGNWVLRAGFAELLSPTGRVALVFTANKANIVAGTDASMTVALTATVDGKSLDETNRGSDAAKEENGTDKDGLFVPVRDQRLYNVVSTADYAQKELVFNVTQGFRLYTFTFG